MILLRGRVVTPEVVLPDGVVEVVDDRILAVRPAETDEATPVGDHVLLPGLVDLHCHGGGGASFTVGDTGQVRAAADFHLAHGTTTLVGSAVTDAPDRMASVVAVLADAVTTGHLAAVHLEGPFLAAARCGAQDPAHLQAPDPRLLADLLTAGRDHVRIVTLAPELPGAGVLLDLLTESGVVAAVGHTEASASVVRRFLREAAPALVTHLFNGMVPLHHRDPGAVLGSLAAAVAGDAVVELVADGVHLDDETVAGVLAVLGAHRVALVTDAMAAAGMDDGVYRLGPQDVRVSGGVARLDRGDSLAGGTSTLLGIARRQVRAGLDPAAVVAAASLVPARVLGRDQEVGALRPGLRADVVVASADWTPVRVMRAGRWVA